MGGRLAVYCQPTPNLNLEYDYVKVGGRLAVYCQPTPNLNLEYDYVKVGGRLAGRHLPANPPPTYALLPGNMPPILAWPGKNLTCGLFTEDGPGCPTRAPTRAPTTRGTA